MASEWPGNYLPSACRGCIVVHRSHPSIYGIFPVKEAEDNFQWDPSSKVFTVVNAKPYPSFTYMTFLETNVLDRHGRCFEAGITRSDAGNEKMAITFVVVADPMTAVRLGAIEGPPTSGFFAIEMERLQAPAAAPSQDLKGLGFPLPEEAGPYLCTQGVGGHLTHFFPESYHAIDLRCANHTPVLSMGDGIVKEIAESHKCGGIHAANLAKWNSVSVLLFSGVIVDYLHTMPGTARVKVGDTVRRGQVLCESGDIGFAPEPHLHVEIHSAADPDGASLPWSFGEGFVPVAGCWYSSTGEVPAPSEKSSKARPGAMVLSKSRRRLQRLERQKRSERRSCQCTPDLPSAAKSEASVK